MKSLKTNLINQYDTTNYLDTIDRVVQITSKMFQLSKMSVNIILVTNDSIQQINNQYRNKDYPTDVLTFPDGTNGNQGDIFISIDKCKEQAIDLQHSFDRELGFLTVHGLLHTLGYDHETKEEEQEMTALQETILKQGKLFR